MESPANGSTSAKFKLGSSAGQTSLELAETCQVSKDQQLNAKNKFASANAEKSGQYSSVIGGENTKEQVSEIDNVDSNFSKCAPELRHSELRNCLLPKPKFASLQHGEGKSMFSSNGQLDYQDVSSFNLPIIKRLSPEDIVKAVNHNYLPPQVKASAGGAEGSLTSPHACPPTASLRSYVGDGANYNKPIVSTRQSQIAAAVSDFVAAGGQQTAFQGKSFAPATWLQYDTDTWHTDAFIPEETAIKKRSNRVIWKPPKATLVFTEPISDRKAGNWNIGDSFKYGEIDDSRFPTEHKLATSENLRNAMSSMKAAEAEARQYCQTKSISFLSMTKESFSKKHNCLPRSTRLDLHLKYRHVMAHMKRQEYQQWESHAMSRSCYTDTETLQQPFKERKSGHFMPIQRSRAVESNLSYPRPTKTKRRNSTQFKHDLTSVLANAYRIKAPNKSQESTSHASHSGSPEGQGRGGRNPSPTSCIIEPETAHHEEGVEGGAPVRCPVQAAPTSSVGGSKRHRQGDGPSTKSSEHTAGFDSTVTETLMKRKQRNAGDASVQLAQIEIECKKHPDHCGCRSCLKTAEWINTLAIPSLKSLDLATDTVGDSRKAKVTFESLIASPSPECPESACSDGQEAFSGALRMSQYSSLGEDNLDV